MEAGHDPSSGHNTPVSTGQVLEDISSDVRLQILLEAHQILENTVHLPL